LQSHLEISEILRKMGSNSTFYFVNGKHRLHFLKVSAAHSINKRQAKRDRREANLEAAAEQWERALAPRRAASAWFDEAKRRGY